jgi:uncharacterized protein YwbE
MPEPKTDYNPDNYNPNSLANIMQFVFADLMIRFDREGDAGYWETHAEVVKIRKRVEKAYQSQITMKKGQKVAVHQVAEGVLLWLREGATVDDVLKADHKTLLLLAR